MKKTTNFVKMMKVTSEGEQYSGKPVTTAKMDYQWKQNDRLGGTTYYFNVSLGAAQFISDAMLLSAADKKIVLDMTKLQVARSIVDEVYGDVVQEMLELKDQYRQTVIANGTYQHNDPIQQKIDDIIESMTP